MARLRLACLALLAGCLWCGAAHAAARTPATWADVLAQPRPAAGERIAYGPGPKQFGDLRLPPGRGRHPVAILLHGGCWQSGFTLDYIAPLADRLAKAGIATWSLEYRGIGDDGGAWPGTFEDVAAGAAHLRAIARAGRLDLDRVVVVGHSAGGHLALWLATQSRETRAKPATRGGLPRIRGVVALAGIVDLRDYAVGAGSCNRSVAPLMGGAPGTQRERYASANPAERLPIGVPMRLLLGSADPIVSREHNARFVAEARARGDDIVFRPLQGAGHFDLVLGASPEAAELERAIRELLGAKRSR